MYGVAVTGRSSISEDPLYRLGSSVSDSSQTRALLLTTHCTGHEYMFTRQQEAGEFDFACLKEYGPTWRVGGLLGVRGICPYRVSVY